MAELPEISPDYLREQASVWQEEDSGVIGTLRGTQKLVYIIALNEPSEPPYDREAYLKDAVKEQWVAGMENDSVVIMCPTPLDVPLIRLSPAISHMATRNPNTRNNMKYLLLHEGREGRSTLKARLCTGWREACQMMFFEAVNGYSTVFVDVILDEDVPNIGLPSWKLKPAISDDSEQSKDAQEEE